jgi:antitoxin component YwqK of YwqJK toxin-antitoxin module
MRAFVFCAEMDTVNQLDSEGKRSGYWVLNTENKPVSQHSNIKSKEGFYQKGRKQGTWILYHKDGKTPRLIGEYADNRPKGAFFRFTTKGEISQAGVVQKEIDFAYSINKKSDLFVCRMLLSNSEVVAGQVFFEQSIFDKPYEYQFWLEDKLYENKVKYEQVNFNWLSQNYSNLFAEYLAVRTPKSIKLTDDSTLLVANKLNEVEAVKEASTNKNNLPPFVSNPKVAKGMIFQRNGFNKLYTPADEIWMDGLFRNGQLYSGKVFEYDKDGVLFRVRVYQDGVYVKDGLI